MTWRTDPASERRWVLRVGVLIFVGTALACSPPHSTSSSSSAAPASQAADRCPTDKATLTGGLRRLAVVVGVGEYAAPVVDDLQGPPNDAQRIYDLLTDEEGGYGFPRANVCLLLDAQATTQAFRRAFEEVLVKRAEPGDVAVVYFAGHGSRVRDQNGDETDGWDETLLFHDARTSDHRDFVDDELNDLLVRLSEKTRRVTVILDSCSSGSATRGSSDAFRARFQPPADERGVKVAPGLQRGRGDAAENWLPKDLTGLVSFSAASDNTSALESEGAGIFTDALLQVLGAQGASPLTYAQAGRRIRPLVAARSHQVPYFQGQLDAIVFASETRRRPMAWEVTGVLPSGVQLSGPPLPGMGAGAELRIYDGASDRRIAHNPSRSKATVVVEAGNTGPNATARVMKPRPDAPEIREGDLAVLIRPSDEFVKLRVRIRPEGEEGGIRAEVARGIESAVTAHPEAAMLVSLTDSRFELELVGLDSGQLSLWGANLMREVFDSKGELLGREVATSLWKHARQKALLALQGEGGDDFRDQESLQVKLVPADRQTACARGEWVQAGENEEQVIPLCYRWHVQVSLSESAPMPLLVGGLVLSTDGGIAAFPHTASNDAGDPVPNWYVKLEPGDTHVFRDVTFEGRPPLDVQDKVLVFGTQESNPVAWHLLAETASMRSQSTAPRSPLFRALDRYLRPGTRAQILIEDDEADDTTWTLTSMIMRVKASRPSADHQSQPGSLAFENVCDPKKRCGAL